MFRIIKSKQGFGTITSVVLAIVLLLVFSIVMEYLRVYTIANGVKEAANESVNILAIQNADKAYDYIREGENNMTHDSQVESRLKNFPELMKNSLGLDSIDTSEYRKVLSSGGTEYTVKDFKVIYSTTPLIFHADFKLVIPVRFAGKIIISLPVSIMVKSNYQNKY